MDERVFAEQLREKARSDGHMTEREMLEWANEIDPQIIPGTVVRFRTPDLKWRYGIAGIDGIHDHTEGTWHYDLEWEVVEIPGPDYYVVPEEDMSMTTFNAIYGGKK